MSRELIQKFRKLNRIHKQWNKDINFLWGNSLKSGIVEKMPKKIREKEVKKAEARIRKFMKIYETTSMRMMSNDFLMFYEDSKILLNNKDFGVFIVK